MSAHPAPVTGHIEEVSDAELKKMFADDPLLALTGIGEEIWADEPADEYVARLRANWGGTE